VGGFSYFEGLEAAVEGGQVPDETGMPRTDALIQPVPPPGDAPSRMYRGLRDASTGLLDDGQISAWLASLPDPAGRHHPAAAVGVRPRANPAAQRPRADQLPACAVARLMHHPAP
jgi:urease accessory protein UreF